MIYERMLDKDHQPTETEILNTIKKASAWLDLTQYIEENYNYVPELVFYGRKYGWTIRYRRSGKTLCSLFPEKGAFTALVVLGKKEIERVLSMINEFDSDLRELIKSTEHLHDGSWLWVRVLNMEGSEGIKKLLSAKKKPKGNKD